VALAMVAGGGGHCALAEEVCLLEKLHLRKAHIREN